MKILEKLNQWLPREKQDQFLAGYLGRLLTLDFAQLYKNIRYGIMSDPIVGGPDAKVMEEYRQRELAQEWHKEIEAERREKEMMERFLNIDFSDDRYRLSDEMRERLAEEPVHNYINISPDLKDKFGFGAGSGFYSGLGRQDPADA